MAKSGSDDVAFRVLWKLETEPNLSQRQLAQELGISVGAVNYCLRALVKKGQVKVRNFRDSRNKLRYAYVLTPRGISAKSRLTLGFLRRKMVEYEALKAEIEQIQNEIGDSSITDQKDEGAPDRA